MGDNKGRRATASVAPNPVADLIVVVPDVHDDDIETLRFTDERSNHYDNRLAQVNLDAPHPHIPTNFKTTDKVPYDNPPSFLKDISTLPAQVSDTLSHEMHKIEDNIHQLLDRGEMFLRQPPPMPEYTDFSLFSTIFSICTYIINIGTDVATGIVLWREPDTKWWFWLTFSIFTAPAFLVNVFSIYWYWTDYRKQNSIKTVLGSKPILLQRWWTACITFHLLLLGPIFRYLNTIYYGIMSRSSRIQRVVIRGPYSAWPKQEEELKRQADFYNLLMTADRDHSLLQLMHCFLQSAPQLILQLYILAKRPTESKTEASYNFTVVVQVVSALTSLFSLAWSLTSYQQVLRYALPDKPNLSIAATISIFLWHFFCVLSRVLSLSLFATTYKSEVFILLLSHWVLMTSWVVAQKTNFCANPEGNREPCQEFLYNVVLGWVYIFVMINVKATPTRLKYAFFNILMFAENATTIVFWFITDSRDHWYHELAIIGTALAFFVGIGFMILYYRRYHPDGIMPDRTQTAKFL